MMGFWACSFSSGVYFRKTEYLNYAAHVSTTHKPRKKASAPCKMSSNHKQQNRFNSCERGKCAMQWTQHGGESKAHPRSSRGSILAAGAFTSHAPQPRLPHAATTRATSLGSFAHGFATNVASVLEHTQRENDPCTTQNDAHVSHKQVYVQRGRCAMHCSQLEPGPYTYR